jgi:hypothetical protein
MVSKKILFCYNKSTAEKKNKSLSICVKGSSVAQKLIERIDNFRKKIPNYGQVEFSRSFASGFAAAELYVKTIDDELCSG